jgi:hypothetical protein
MIAAYTEPDETAGISALFGLPLITSSLHHCVTGRALPGHDTLWNRLNRAYDCLSQEKQ